MPRAAGGEKWWDPTLLEWPENDFRIFVGDLGNEVNDDVLTKSFQKYTSFAKAKVVRDKRSNKSKGARSTPPPNAAPCSADSVWRPCACLQQKMHPFALHGVQACVHCVRPWMLRHGFGR